MHVVDTTTIAGTVSRETTVATEATVAETEAATTEKGIFRPNESTTCMHCHNTHRCNGVGPIPSCFCNTLLLRTFLLFLCFVAATTATESDFGTTAFAWETVLYYDDSTYATQLPPEMVEETTESGSSEDQLMTTHLPEIGQTLPFFPISLSSALSPYFNVSAPHNSVLTSHPFPVSFPPTLPPHSPFISHNQFPFHSTIAFATPSLPHGFQPLSSPSSSLSLGSKPSTRSATSELPQVLPFPSSFSLPFHSYPPSAVATSRLPHDPRPFPPSPPHGFPSYPPTGIATSLLRHDPRPFPPSSSLPVPQPPIRPLSVILSHRPSLSTHSPTFSSSTMYHGSKPPTRFATSEPQQVQPFPSSFSLPFHSYPPSAIATSSFPHDPRPFPPSPSHGFPTYPPTAIATSILPHDPRPFPPSSSLPVPHPPIRPLSVISGHHPSLYAHSPTFSSSTVYQTSPILAPYSRRPYHKTVPPKLFPYRSSFKFSSSPYLLKTSFLRHLISPLFPSRTSLAPLNHLSSIISRTTDRSLTGQLTL